MIKLTVVIIEEYQCYQRHMIHTELRWKQEGPLKSWYSPRQNPEHLDLNLHFRENLKFRR